MFSLGSNTFTQKSGWRPGRTSWVQPGIALVYFSKRMSLPQWAIRSYSLVIIITRVSGSKVVHSAFQKSQGTQWLKVSSNEPRSLGAGELYPSKRTLNFFFCFFFFFFFFFFWYETIMINRIELEPGGKWK